MKSFVLRLEEGVHEELKSRALRERRSMHAVALLALESFLKPVDKSPGKGVEDIPVDELVGAKHDAVHQEPSGGRAAKTHRVGEPDKPSKSVGTSGGPSVRNIEFDPADNPLSREAQAKRGKGKGKK